MKSIEQERGESIESLLSRLYWEIHNSIPKVASDLGVSNETASRWFDRIGVETRSVSQANIHRWESLSEEEQDDRVDPLVQSGKEREGQALKEWRAEGNGTGQDHYRWNGGTRTTEALRTLLSTDSWETISERVRNRDNRECQMCSTPEEDMDERLHVHHLIPLMAGGSNDDELLMSLCRQCHVTVESRTTEMFEWVIPDGI